PPPRDRSPPGRPSRRRCEPSELLVDLRRLAKLRQIVLSLLHHRLAREPVADLLLHFRERPRSDLPAILHGDEMEPSVIAGDADQAGDLPGRSEEHTSELQSRFDLVCRLLLEKKKRRHIRFRASVPTRR